MRRRALPPPPPALAASEAAPRHSADARRDLPNAGDKRCRPPSPSCRGDVARRHRGRSGRRRRAARPRRDAAGGARRRHHRGRRRRPRGGLRRQHRLRKLASRRIRPQDTATLQRNLILSHCCGVGEEAPRGHRPADDGAEDRLARPRGLRRPAGSDRADRAHAGGGREPRHSRPGLRRGLGRPRAARPSRRRDDRRGRGPPWRPAHGRGEALAAAGSSPDHAWAEGGSGADQRHAVLDRPRARGGPAGRAPGVDRAGDRRAVGRRSHGLDHAVPPEIHAMRGLKGQIEAGRFCRRCCRAAASATPIWMATNACKTRTACAASRRSWARRWT